MAFFSSQRNMCTFGHMWSVAKTQHPDMPHPNQPCDCGRYRWADYIALDCYYLDRDDPSDGVPCRVITRGIGPGPLNCLIEFLDGFRCVTESSRVVSAAGLRSTDDGR